MNEMNFQEALQERLAKARFGADPVYPMKVTVATVSTGALGRLYLRSFPTAGDTSNVIGSVNRGMTVSVTGPTVDNFSPVEVSGNSNASGANEPGGSNNGSWPKGTKGFMASGYLKALGPDNEPVLLSNTLPPGADLGGSPPPTLANTPGPLVHPTTGQPVTPPSLMIKNKYVVPALLAVGAVGAAAVGIHAYKNRDM